MHARLPRDPPPGGGHIGRPRRREDLRAGASRILATRPREIVGDPASERRNPNDTPKYARRMELTSSHVQTLYIYRNGAHPSAPAPKSRSGKRPRRGGAPRPRGRAPLGYVYRVCCSRGLDGICLADRGARFGFRGGPRLCRARCIIHDAVRAGASGRGRWGVGQVGECVCVGGWVGGGGR